MSRPITRSQLTFDDAPLSTRLLSIRHDFAIQPSFTPNAQGACSLGLLSSRPFPPLPSPLRLLAFPCPGSYIIHRGRRRAVDLFTLRRPRTFVVPGSIAGPGDRCSMCCRADHRRQPDAQPAGLWDTHSPGFAAMLVPGPHRASVPCLRDDDQLRLFRARSSAE